MTFFFITGWEYSRITTIIIQKVGAPRTRSILNAADLVFADGCRNPSYKVRIWLAQNTYQDIIDIEDIIDLLLSLTINTYLYIHLHIPDSANLWHVTLGCWKKGKFIGGYKAGVVRNV